MKAESEKVRRIIERTLPIGNVRRPWDAHSLVTLLDMLNFAAETFFRMSAVLTKFSIRPDMAIPQDGMNELYDCVAAVVNYCRVLGLKLSLNKAVEVHNLLVLGKADEESLRNGLKELHSRIFEELNAELFKLVPRHKMSYADPSNFERPELIKFGWITVCEFQRAGGCFAFGEDTACAFHLFRIVDAGLRATAKRLDVDWENGNWMAISGKIEREMKKKYQEKTDDWKESESFFAGILTDILAISKARNRALHDFKCTYGEEEVQRLFTIVDGFICHLSAGGLQEA